MTGKLSAAPCVSSMSVGPFLVRIGRVNAQADDLDAALIEFGFELAPHSRARWCRPG